jgi:glycerol-3-phosphate acyltransferase PlsY
MSSLIVALAAYLLGSVPFAVVVSRAFGLADPRSFGSGNPGATNVLRAGNKLAAALTLLGDVGKGLFAVVLTEHLGPAIGATPADVALAGFAAFFGHLHSVFLRFRGGKGVATALGVLLGFELWLGVGCAAVWIAVAAIFRYSSLAAVAAALAAPALALLLLGPGDHATAVLCMSVLLLWRHFDNIRRLREGKESRIGQRKADDQPAGESS